MLEALNRLTLPLLAQRQVATPAYPRTGAISVVHLGLGAFHRAHQAMVFDAILQSGDARWGVLGVAMRTTQLADVLAAQDGLYAVQIADQTGSSWQVPGAIWQTRVAERERQQVVQAISAPATRWITLTVTEKGYVPALANLIVEGLRQRCAQGLPGLTIASCDNLSRNGDQLKALCLQEAHDNLPLAEWVAMHCAFPNSMVDRIVPAATPARLAAASAALGVADNAALGTEAFWEWVMERNFCDPSDADVLSRAGVTVVDDVAPYEEAKLRLLNASHSAMACIGAVAGLPVISDCIGQPEMRRFIGGLMTHEVGPQMRRADWAVYRDALLARFANPALQHSVHQIATDSSQKIPQRWVPSALGAIERGLPFERLAFAAAAWLRYLRGVDDSGASYPINDPMAETLQQLAAACGTDADQAVQMLGRVILVWGEALPLDALWLKRVSHWLDCINQQGILAALAELNTACARQN